jgi:hypothetical protein
MRQSRIDSRLFNWFNILVFEEKKYFRFCKFLARKLLNKIPKWKPFQKLNLIGC